MTFIRFSIKTSGGQHQATCEHKNPHHQQAEARSKQGLHVRGAKGAHKTGFDASGIGSSRPRTDYKTGQKAC
ncbi:hypothetical protein QC763_0060320 [Podospora pseudopauciseta]|uniref:Uncharacterized protein n=1 Tax=Podospora pseudopauciseta TaxID=2093780 RepID=A0ABR0HB59_9PEZI|nr:hypothetical protein QC763_0060320 [Podospora pseudopauciseta]